MSWDNGLQFGSALAQYAIFLEFAVMGALMILGALVEILFRRGHSGETIDDDD